ncbi:MAG TPA: hypothetical protein VNO70_20585 [Blastocatellia bacterium]|nr:hypothetical protein [Blastocatellia bacterium]
MLATIAAESGQFSFEFLNCRGAPESPRAGRIQGLPYDHTQL